MNCSIRYVDTLLVVARGNHLPCSSMVLSPRLHRPRALLWFASPDPLLRHRVLILHLTSNSSSVGRMHSTTTIGDSKDHKESHLYQYRHCSACCPSQFTASILALALLETPYPPRQWPTVKDRRMAHLLNHLGRDACRSTRHDLLRSSRRKRRYVEGLNAGSMASRRLHTVNTFSCSIQSESNSILP